MGCVREDNQDTFEVIVSLEKPVYALFESNDRRNNLQESAVFKNDQRIITILDSEEFIDNAVYHSGCITKYLLWYCPGL
jgi:hypothetical protein